jgi:hypothetical protein
MVCWKGVHVALAMGGLGLQVVLLGCGSDPLGRQPVRGTVKVNGTPLAQGDISFQPLEGQPTASGAMIREGAFSIPREQGLAPGKYRVILHAPVPGTGGKVDPNALPGDPVPPPRELFPPEWNERSQQTVEVQAGKPAQFDFDVSLSRR